MNKAKLAAGAALGMSVAAVLGVFGGIMMTHGPANTPEPHQTPAAVVQLLDTTPADPTTTGDDVTADPTTTTEQAPPVDTSTPAAMDPTDPPAATTTEPPADTRTRTDSWVPMPTAPNTAATTTNETPIVTPQNPPGVVETTN